MVDIPLPPIGRPRWRVAPGVMASYYAMMRAMPVAILLSIGWSAALSLSEALRRCDTAAGKLNDRMHTVLFKTPSACGCDGTIDLRTGCVQPMLGGL
jgi:hypothetical protein